MGLYINKYFEAISKGEKMANKKIMWEILGVALVFGFLVAGCSTPPPVRPALSQTVINVQRGSTRLDAGNLFIYVDDLIINKKAPIKKGQFATYPVNNGVHYIHGVCGKLVSEAINFTASSETVSFVATVEKGSGLFGKKKLVISRSTVSNETGRQTDLDIQESYGDIQ
jgi:hypothetical protein